MKLHIKSSRKDIIILVLLVLVTCFIAGSAYVAMGRYYALPQFGSQKMIWRNYHNTKYGFQISYPSSSAIETGGSNTNGPQPASGKEDHIYINLRVGTSLYPNFYYAFICVASVLDKNAHCYPGNVTSPQAITRTLTIDGKTYTANGYRYITASPAGSVSAEGVNVKTGTSNQSLVVSYGIAFLTDTVSDEEYSALEYQLQSIIKTLSFDAPTATPTAK